MTTDSPEISKRVSKGFQPDPPEFSDIANSRNANDQRREDQRHNDHQQHAQEQRTDRLRNVRHEPNDVLVAAAERPIHRQPANDAYE